MDKKFEVTDANGARHEIGKISNGKEFRFTLDEKPASNEEIAAAYGDVLTHFESVMSIYCGKKPTNPVSMTDESRMTLALLFAIVPVQNRRKTNAV